MASAEQLLNEAQYALHSINSGESRDNGRNASRARALSKKIIRKFPTSTEANSAHSILRRLGDEAYVSGLGAPHEGVVEHVFHKVQSPESQQRPTQSDETVVLDWAGLLRLIFSTQKSGLAVVVIVVGVLFANFGPFLLIALFALLLFKVRFKQMLNPSQGQKMNELITRINAHVAEQRKTDRL